jgi:hypothetical protein
MELIYGHRFFDKCDIIYAPGTELPHRDMVTIGCCTHNLGSLLQACRAIDAFRYIIVSHNSDYHVSPRPVTGINFQFVERAVPSSVLKIYSQNCDVLSSKIRPLPIGLENPVWHQGKMEALERAIQVPGKKEHWLYMNHSVSTNPDQRKEAYMMLGHKGWVTAERGKNGDNFDHYIKQVGRHRFMLCPEGNGLDTHRVWEALYMGSIPIVRRRVFMEMFARVLPMLIVDGWDQVTLPFLEHHWKRLKNRSRAALDFNWWWTMVENLGGVS